MPTRPNSVPLLLGYRSTSLVFRSSPRLHGCLVPRACRNLLTRVLIGPDLIFPCPMPPPVFVFDASAPLQNLRFAWPVCPPVGGDFSSATSIVKSLHVQTYRPPLASAFAFRERSCMPLTRASLLIDKSNCFCMWGSWRR